MSCERRLPSHCTLALSVLGLLACSADPSSGSGESGECIDPTDTDGDGISDCEELAAGLDPELSDSDGDGDEDGDELDCGSDPLDAEEQCFDCGWVRSDPGDLESSGSSEGDVIANLDFIDQCGEEVQLWDFAEEYHILWMTAAW
jgi:hypothetical protein